VASVVVTICLSLLLLAPIKLMEKDLRLYDDMSNVQISHKEIRYEGMYWIYLAQNTFHWWVPVN